MESGSGEEKQSREQSRERRSRTRRQLWLVLAGLFLFAIALTAWRWYQGEHVVPNRPLAWVELDWPTIERELDRGRRMVVLVAEPDSSPEKDELLNAFETPAVRQRLYYASVLAVKLKLPADNVPRDGPTWDRIRQKLGIETLPVVTIGSRAENRIVLDQQVTSGQIVDTIGSLFGKPSAR